MGFMVFEGLMVMWVLGLGFGSGEATTHLKLFGLEGERG